MSCFKYDFDWIPLTTFKEASNITGLSVSAFKVLVADGVIETSKRDSKIDYVKNSSLAKYLAIYGGREEKRKDFIASEIHKAQIKKINYNFKLVSAINKANEKDFERLKKTKSYKTIENDILKSIIEIRSEDVNMFLGQDLFDVLDFEAVKKLNEDSCYNQCLFFPKSNTVDKTIYMRNIITIHNTNKSSLLELYDLGFTDKVLEKYYDNTIDVNERIGNTTIELNITVPSEDGYYNFFNTYKQNQIDYKNLDYDLPFSVIKNIITKSRKKFAL